MSTSVSRLAADTGLSVEQVLELCRRAGVSAWGPTTILLEGDLRQLQPHLAASVAPPQAFSTAPPPSQPMPPPGQPMPPPGQAFGAPPPPGGYGAPPPPGPFGAMPPPGYIQPGYGVPSQPPRKGGSRAKTALIAVAIVVAGIVGLGIIGAIAGDPEEGDASGPSLPNIPDVLDIPDPSVPEFAVGDCYDDHSDVTLDTSTSMVEAQVEKVPCSSPHDAEVYFLFNHPAPPDSTYPGDGAIFDAAVNGCMPQFEAFVGIPYEDSALDIYFLTPSQLGFNRLDDREIVCSVVNLDGSPMPGGTARGSRR